MFGVKKIFGKLVEIRALASVDVVPEKMPTVKFDKSKLTPAVKAQLQKDIASFDEIGKRNEGKILLVALEALSRGRDMDHLFAGLSAIDGMSKSSAHRITRLLTNRAGVTMTIESRSSLGLFEAKWRYANAPCMKDPKCPSESDIQLDAAHKALDGKIFDIRQGMVVDGVTTWPGYEEGCRCGSNSVLPF